MKKCYAVFLLSILLYACSEQPKTTTVKYTDTSVRDTLSPKALTALKNDSVAKLLESLSANDSIIPGKCIGNIPLEANTDELIAVLGQPDSAETRTGGSVLSWYSNLPGKAADSIRNSLMVFRKIIAGKAEVTNRAKQVRVTSSFFKTSNMAGVGSTIVFIKMQFPSLKKATGSYADRNGNTVTVYDAVKEGISFEIGGLTKCIGITIHQPGEKVIPLWETSAAGLTGPALRNL